MNEDNYILPIGSIVRLKKGDILLMIVGRAQLFNQNGKVGYFDYSATLYPQGIDGSQEFVFFNIKDIDEIIFEGYRNSQEIDFANNYEKNVEASTYPKLVVED